MLDVGSLGFIAKIMNLTIYGGADKVAGANRRWRRCQFHRRGSRRESAVARLFSLGIITRHGKTRHHRKYRCDSYFEYGTADCRCSAIPSVKRAISCLPELGCSKICWGVLVFASRRQTYHWSMYNQRIQHDSEHDWIPKDAGK